MRVYSLRQFLGDSIQLFAPFYFREGVSRRDAALRPNDHQMIEQVGAFEDNRLAIRLHGVETNLDRFLDEFFRHLLHAVAKQLRGSRQTWIAVARGQHRLIKSLQRISHLRFAPVGFAGLYA